MNDHGGSGGTAPAGGGAAPRREAGGLIEVRGLVRSYGPTPALRGVTDALVEAVRVASEGDPSGALETLTFEDLGDGRTRLRATGQVMLFDGFLKLYQEGRDDNGEEGDESRRLPEMREGEATTLREVKPEQNALIRAFRRFVPVTPELHGQRFFVRIRGVLHATPLLIALLFLEATDIVFAVDSVPAIFALTREPLIVFTSNIFAILGLRALYFLLAGAVDRFHMLKYGLALVLVFVGLKMVWLNHLFGGKFPISISLGIILGVIAVSVAASLLFPKRRPAEAPVERADAA